MIYVLFCATLGTHLSMPLFKNIIHFRHRSAGCPKFVGEKTNTYMLYIGKNSSKNSCLKWTVHSAMKKCSWQSSLSKMYMIMTMKLGWVKPSLRPIEDHGVQMIPLMLNNICVSVVVRLVSVWLSPLSNSSMSISLPSS